MISGNPWVDFRGAEVEERDPREQDGPPEARLMRKGKGVGRPGYPSWATR